jgi:hypothetical protein
VWIGWIEPEKSSVSAKEETEPETDQADSAVGDETSSIRVSADLGDAQT